MREVGAAGEAREEDATGSVSSSFSAKNFLVAADIAGKVCAEVVFVLGDPFTKFDEQN